MTVSKGFKCGNFSTAPWPTSSKSAAAAEQAIHFALLDGGAPERIRGAGVVLSKILSK
ncbi:MAG: hypothetical protein ABSG78_07855 [Verrucomicrobiota bacterium]|jgi:hypothetical protein